MHIPNLQAARIRITEFYNSRLALEWRFIYAARDYLTARLVGRWRYILVASFVTLVGYTFHAAVFFQPSLEALVGADIGNVKSLLSSLGGALVGATAIAFSLIIFSMQVNVERMPHGLFQKISFDKNLLGCFVLSFTLAITISSLSVVVSRENLAITAIAAFWAVAIILSLLIYSYVRAVMLVSPIRQLAMVASSAGAELQYWVRRANRLSPLFAAVDPAGGAEVDAGIRRFDAKRLVIFRQNSAWANSAFYGVRDCVSYARRYSVVGDYEVAAAANQALVSINRCYVLAKGRTFFASNVFVDNPLATDSFINETLESLRQTNDIGISRGDERQITQTLDALQGLVFVYLEIDYCTERSNRFHPALAASYLAGAVRSVIPLKRPDVLMHGLRRIGEVARKFLAEEMLEQIPAVSEKIAQISVIGVALEDHRPVLQIGIGQLAQLTFGLLRSPARNVGFAIGEVRGDIRLLVELFLKTKSSSAFNFHSTYLGDYYSTTSSTSFLQSLSALANAICDAEGGNKSASLIADNLAEWSDGIYENEKQIMLLAISNRSHFTFDIIHWIAHASKILMAVSTANACDENVAEKLKKNALWLVSVLSWCPKDEDSVKFLEAFQLTELHFETSMAARQFGDDAARKATRDHLLSWTMTAGAHQSGWAILERGCCGLAVLEGLNQQDGVDLVAELSSELSKTDSPSVDMRRQAARGLRRQAMRLGSEGYSVRVIERAMHMVDEDRMRHLLLITADCLSPDAAAEPFGFF